MFIIFENYLLKMPKLEEIKRKWKILKIGGNPRAFCFRLIHHFGRGIQKLTTFCYTFN
jgi:hypothetical protein